MELDKIRNLGPHELKHEEQQASEQLFRLRFQMRLGQTEGVKIGRASCRERVCMLV